MRWSLAARAVITLGLAIPFVAHAQTATPSTYGRLSTAEVQRLAANANQRVFVILRDQHHELASRANQQARAALFAREQAPVISELNQVKAARVQGYHLINAVSATVSKAEEAHLRSEPQVAAVVPDAVIHQSPQILDRAQAASGPSMHSVLPQCAFQAELAPEALGLTNTAFQDPKIPQAQNYVDGKGVLVAFMADGLDINNPDFIRPDGSHVFVDYQDFSGDGVNAPTKGGEAFGDASSIAAQGNETYNVNDFVANAHRRNVACPQVKVLGMAPGASMMGLKVFNNEISWNSSFVQAIQYAVDKKVDVLNQSFGGNPFPDNANDPIALADQAAVAAGMTITVSSGDAGTAGTIQSPSTLPGVIEVGASTQLRSYIQDFYYGAQTIPGVSNGGYVSNNISSFSSAGIAQSGIKTVDVVAPGDLGWAVCTANLALYADCTNENGQPSNLQLFGGTSESAPLTAGEAALVIEAFRRTHGGATPTPALVKQIIMSTAADLNTLSYEQGAGLINSLKAVQAAESWNVKNRQGDALLYQNTTPGGAPDILTALDTPGTTRTFTVQYTNVGAKPETVRPMVDTLGLPFYRASYSVKLDPKTDPTFLNAAGAQRAYVKQTFTVPGNVQHLDAAISWNVAAQPYSFVYLMLFDPHGNVVDYTLPQDLGFPFGTSGYGHVDVRFPTAGKWTAIIFTRTTSTGFTGTVHLDVSGSNFVSAGSVFPSSRVLQPGQSGTFTVRMGIPTTSGDFNAEVRAAGAGAIPVILRVLVPMQGNTGQFSGILTGGNGRPGAPGQTLTYAFNVPSGKRDLSLGLSLRDSNYNLEGILVNPAGLPIDVQSTVTAFDNNNKDATFGMPIAYTNTMQFFRRDPEAGLWRFVLIINNNISGAQTSLPFNASIALNAVNVTASDLPNDANTTLAAGQTKTVTVTIKNTGNTTKSYFIDPRLTNYVPMAVGGANNISLPTSFVSPSAYVPPESNELFAAAESTSKPSVPVNMDVSNADGTSPFGGLGSPDIEAFAGKDPQSGNYAAAVDYQTSEVPFGFWGAGITEVGPYPPDGGTPSAASFGAAVMTQQFDSQVASSSGDAYALIMGMKGSYSPLVLKPGQSGTITVTITPDAGTNNANVGNVVTGHLYVDTLTFESGFLMPGMDDEVIALPYKYKVGANNPT